MSLVCLLALTSSTIGGRSPTNESGTQQPSDAGQRFAEVIRNAFQTDIEGFTEAAGGTWTYRGGSAFSASDRKPYMPQPCGGDDGPHQLLLMVTSGPHDDGPAAIERMKSLLEDHGMKITGYIPGKSKREGSAIEAERASGQFVSDRTNDLRTTVRFGSECSSDPTMLSDLD